MIDEKVIDAHVIPRQALFLKPTPYHEIFKTIAFGEFFKVTVSFPGDVIAHSEKRKFRLIDKKNYKRKEKLRFNILILLGYVKSHTVLGDPKHPSGVVLSEVVFANIPVQNGVVHLIRQPLAIIDKTIQQFIEVRYFISTFVIYVAIASKTYLITGCLINTDFKGKQRSKSPPLYNVSDRTIIVVATLLKKLEVFKLKHFTNIFWLLQWCHLFY